MIISIFKEDDIVTKMKEKFEFFQKEISNLELKLKQKCSDTELQNQFEKKCKENEELVLKFQSLQEQMEENEGLDKISKFEKAIEHKEKANAILVQNLESLKEKYKILETKLVKVDSIPVKINENSEEDSISVKNLEAQISKLNAQCEEKEQENTKLIQNFESLNEKHAMLEIKLAIMSSENVNSTIQNEVKEITNLLEKEKKKFEKLQIEFELKTKENKQLILNLKNCEKKLKQKSLFSNSSQTKNNNNNTFDTENSNLQMVAMKEKIMHLEKEMKEKEKTLQKLKKNRIKDDKISKLQIEIMNLRTEKIENIGSKANQILQLKHKIKILEDDLFSVKDQKEDLEQKFELFKV